MITNNECWVHLKRVRYDINSNYTTYTTYVPVVRRQSCGVSRQTSSRPNELVHVSTEPRSEGLASVPRKPAHFTSDGTLQPQSFQHSKLSRVHHLSSHLVLDHTHSQDFDSCTATTILRSHLHIEAATLLSAFRVCLVDLCHYIYT